MRAVQVRETGGPEVLELVEVDDPTPGPAEVLIDVRAAGVNFIDTYQRGGLYPIELPFTPGLEASGVIVAVGDDVDEFQPGDRVAVSEGAGSYADLRLAPAGRVVPIPDGVDFDVAVAAGIQGMTAHYLAVDTYPLGPGDRCLVHAAAGGTGRLLVQIAKRAGAEVFATAGTEEKAELARSAGADHVIVYTEVGFADAIREIAGTDRPLDVVYDGVGTSVFDDSLSLLRVRGTMVTFGNASGPVDPIPPLRLMTEGSLYLTRPTLFDYIVSRDELVARSNAVLSWIANGELEVRIDTIYPLADASRAHTDLEARRSTGKLVIRP